MSIEIKNVKVLFGKVPHTGPNGNFINKLKTIDTYVNSAGDVVSFDQINSFYLVTEKKGRSKQIITTDNLGVLVALILGKKNTIIHDPRGVFKGKLNVVAQFDRYDIVMDSEDRLVTETINDTELTFFNEHGLDTFHNRIEERTRSLIKGLSKINPLSFSEYAHSYSSSITIKIFTSDHVPSIVVDQRNHITYVESIRDMAADDLYLWKDEFGVAIRRDVYSDDHSKYFTKSALLTIGYTNMVHAVSSRPTPMGPDLSIMVNEINSDYSGEIVTNQTIIGAVNALVKASKMGVGDKGKITYNGREFFLDAICGMSCVRYVARSICGRWKCWTTTNDRVGDKLINFTVVSVNEQDVVAHHEVNVDIQPCGGFTIPASGFFTELRNALERHDSTTILTEADDWVSVDIEKLSIEVFKDHTKPYTVKAVINDCYDTVYNVEVCGFEHGIIPLTTVKRNNIYHKVSYENRVATIVRTLTKSEGEREMINNDVKIHSSEIIMGNKTIVIKHNVTSVISVTEMCSIIDHLGKSLVDEGDSAAIFTSNGSNKGIAISISSGGKDQFWYSFDLQKWQPGDAVSRSCLGSPLLEAVVSKVATPAATNEKYTWIPSKGMYVKLDHRNDSEVYILEDYDALDRMAWLIEADSARAERRIRFNETEDRSYRDRGVFSSREMRKPIKVGLDRLIPVTITTSKQIIF